MSQNNENKKNPCAVAVVGRSLLFPVSLSPQAFWPNLLAMLMGDVNAGPMVEALGKWPFNEFLTPDDFNNIKGFIKASGLFANGGFPADGFAIPAEILKISKVLQVIPLCLANQALNETISYKKDLIPAERVHVIIESGRQNPEDTSPPVKMFAGHHGFKACEIIADAPVAGSLVWLGQAVKSLQAMAADLIIAGSAHSTHSILALIDGKLGSKPGKIRFIEGLGMLALRRLEDAERDGDQILAVISGVDSFSVELANPQKVADKVVEVAKPSAAAIMPKLGRLESLAKFARLSLSDIVEDASGKCLNLPFNSFRETAANNANDPVSSASLSWKLLRERWVTHTGSKRFFHDLLGVLCGTFISRVVVQSPAEFKAVTARPVIYLANHQIGIESPLFMAIAYAMTGLPVQAVAKPDHVDAWLSFLMAFAQDSLGDCQPFSLMYYDRQNPLGLIETLKNSAMHKASLLVHVEGTRSMSADQPVTKISSIFLDVAVAKDIVIVPVRFVGGLPQEPTASRLDFPYGNGKQDYLLGAPILPEQLRSLPYGQRPRLVMDRINNLGPGKTEDVLLPPNPEFEAKTKFLMQNVGLPKMQAMLFSILLNIDDPCEETAILIKAVQSGKIDLNRPDMPPVLKNFITHLKSKFA